MKPKKWDFNMVVGTILAALILIVLVLGIVGLIVRVGAWAL